MIVLKRINMTLDPKSIKAAIKAVKDFEKELYHAMTHLIEDLTKQGVEFARMELMMFDRPAFFSGRLYDSIEGELVSDTKGKVFTNVEYAVFVEYGTGIVGAGNPHPEPNGYDYDVKGHGWAGWVYKGDDGQFHQTYGMASRPFMFYTLRDLQNFAEQNGGRIIAEYIP